MIDKFLDVVENEVNEFKPNGFSNMDIIIFFINFLTVVFLVIPIKFINVNSKIIKYYNLIWESKWIVLWVTIVIIFECTNYFFIKFENDYIFPGIYMISKLINKFFCFYMSIYFLIGVFIIKSGYIEDMNILFSNILMTIVILFSFMIVCSNFIDIIKQLFKKNDVFWKYRNKKDYMDYIITKYKEKDNESIEKQLLLCQLYEKTSLLYDKNILLDTSGFEEYKRNKIKNNRI